MEKVMKIGILTYPLNNNYGCYLQSYALLTLLKKKGYDVEYIYRRHNKPSIKFYFKYVIKKIIKNIVKHEWGSLIYNYEREYMLRKGGDMYLFFEEHICPHTEIIYTTRKLKNICKKYDAIIVGSDQIWRAEILSNIEDYYLAFLPETSLVKRIAYAASFGKNDPGYTPKQIKRCGRAISKFSAISIREDVGKDILIRFGWNCPMPKVVVDPTMLLNKEDYTLLIKGYNYEETIFGYILDKTDEKQKILYQVSEFFGVRANNILENVKADDFIYPSVYSWLGFLANSKFVVTDSFHGVVFSIIFNKPFAVIVNEGRGAARFETLLNKFNLNERVLKNGNTIFDLVKNPINWELVNNCLERERRESLNYLSRSLE